MNSPAPSEIDCLILSFARAQWRKMAMVISQVVSEFGRRGIDVDEYAVAGRIRVLVEDGRLEAQDNLLIWRLSEVKLSG